jgi:hypothetical protein
LHSRIEVCQGLGRKRLVECLGRFIQLSALDQQPDGLEFLLLLSLFLSRNKFDLSGIQQLRDCGVRAQGDQCLLRQFDRFAEFFPIDFNPDVANPLFDGLSGLLLLVL